MCFTWHQGRTQDFFQSERLKIEIKPTPHPPPCVCACMALYYVKFSGIIFVLCYVFLLSLLQIYVDDINDNCPIFSGEDSFQFFPLPVLNNAELAVINASDRDSGVNAELTYLSHALSEE